MSREINRAMTLAGRSTLDQQVPHSFSMAKSVRFALCCLVLLLSGFVFTTGRCQANDDQGSSGVETATLEQRLKFGLKARRPEEFEYLGKVVDFVEAGVLPQELVDQSFFWVRKNKPNTNFPFIYFEQVLRLQGKRAGVPVPNYTGPYKIQSP